MLVTLCGGNWSEALDEFLSAAAEGGQMIRRLLNTADKLLNERGGADFRIHGCPQSCPCVCAAGSFRGRYFMVVHDLSLPN
jgi:hypothetical protein